MEASDVMGFGFGFGDGLGLLLFFGVRLLGVMKDFEPFCQILRFT
jgi:hypothetical protein